MRRQGAASGPVRAGVVPVAARLRADHQSVPASSASAAMASFELGHELAGWQVRENRRPKGHRGPPGVDALGPAGPQAARALYVQGHDGAATAGRQPRRPAPVGLAPAIRAAPAFGEDEQVPALGQQFLGSPGRVPAHPLAIDRYGVEREGEIYGLNPGVEEIVGGGEGHDLVAPLVGKHGQDQGSVKVARVVGGKNDRRAGVLEAVEPTDGGLGHGGHDGAGDDLGPCRPGQADRVAPRPFGVVVDTEVRMLARARDSRGPGGRAQGEGERAPQLRSPVGRLPSPARPSTGPVGLLSGHWPA